MTPKQTPGKSKQDYSTPALFIDAVKRRLRITDFSIDLAADASNAEAAEAYIAARTAAQKDAAS